MPEMVTVADNPTGKCVICGKRPGELRHTLPAEIICPICWKFAECFLCGGEPDNFICLEDGTLYFCSKCVDFENLDAILSMIAPDLEIGEYDPGPDSKEEGA